MSDFTDFTQIYWKLTDFTDFNEITDFTGKYQVFLLNPVPFSVSLRKLLILLKSLQNINFFTGMLYRLMYFFEKFTDFTEISSNVVLDWSFQGKILMKSSK